MVKPISLLFGQALPSVLPVPHMDQAFCIMDQAAYIDEMR